MIRFIDHMSTTEDEYMKIVGVKEAKTFTKYPHLSKDKLQLQDLNLSSYMGVLSVLLAEDPSESSDESEVRKPDSVPLLSSLLIIDCHHDFASWVRLYEVAKRFPSLIDLRVEGEICRIVQNKQNSVDDREFLRVIRKKEFEGISEQHRIEINGGIGGWCQFVSSLGITNLESFEVAFADLGLLHKCETDRFYDDKLPTLKEWWETNADSMTTWIRNKSNTPPRRPYSILPFFTSIDSLAATLPFSRLRVLALPGNSISDKSVPRLSLSLLSSKLEYLDLAENDISDLGFMDLFCFASVVGIKALDLRENHITGVSWYFEPLKEASHHWFDERFVYLAGNPIEDEEIERFETVMGRVVSDWGLLKESRKPNFFGNLTAPGGGLLIPPSSGFVLPASLNTSPFKGYEDGAFYGDDRSAPIWTDALTPISDRSRDNFSSSPLRSGSEELLNVSASDGDVELDLD